MHPPATSIASEHRDPVPHCAGCGLAVPSGQPIVTYERLAGAPTDGIRPGTVHPETLTYHVHCAQLAQRTQRVGSGWVAYDG